MANQFDGKDGNGYQPLPCAKADEAVPPKTACPKSARIAELESMVRKLVLQSLPVEELEGMPGWSEVQDALKLNARIAELERECERLRERLEINGQCPYDGIATRDITIEVLEREIDRFKEANQRLSEEAVNRRNSAVEARRSASDLMAANMGLWAEAEDTKAERDTLRAELEACRKDAERYRWLRDNGDAGDHDLVVARMYAINEIPELRCEVASYDEAIDAAMQEANADASS